MSSGAQNNVASVVIVIWDGAGSQGRQCILGIIMCIIWHNKCNKKMLIAHAFKHNLFLKNKGKCFPSGSVVNNLPANAGDTG